MDKIVACVDGANYTGAVCDYAAWAALRLTTPLEFVHVLEKTYSERLDASGSIGLGAQEALLSELVALDQQRNTLAREHGRQILEGAQKRASAAGVEHVAVHQRHGELIETLTELEPETRLYVLGQHDHESKPKRFLLDHNLESAARALHRPILVANATFSPPTRVMIAFDASTTGRKMIDMVADSPLLRELDCVVASVGEDAASLRWAEDRLGQAGFKVSATQLSGEPADALLEFAGQNQVDMLVMGAYGHSRIRQLVVGSTTTAILRRAMIPVFVLR